MPVGSERSPREGREGDGVGESRCVFRGGVRKIVLCPRSREETRVTPGKWTGRNITHVLITDVILGTDLHGDDVPQSETCVSFRDF